MNLNFSEVLASLGPNAALTIANQARAGGEYLFASVLPETPIADYNVSDANMTVRSMMAGLVGMDSPYPPTGYVEASSFKESTLKVANHASIPEEVMRQLQAIVVATGGGSATNQRIQQEVLNFYAKVILQPHFDTAEWLRGRALQTGALDWTFNGISINVDYGIPTENIFPVRTGDDGYGGDLSMFWVDVLEAKRLLHGNLAYAIAHSTTIDTIISNGATNNLYVMNDGGGFVDLVAWMPAKTGQILTPHPDGRYRLRLYAYDLEGEVYDTANPNQTIKIPFMDPGKIVYIGKNDYDRVYRVGMGSTDDPNAKNQLGFTAIAPTVEGGGVPGRWGRLIVKENTPWQLEGEAVTNLLPILRAPEKVVIAETELA